MRLGSCVRCHRFFRQALTFEKHQSRFDIAAHEKGATHSMVRFWLPHVVCLKFSGPDADDLFDRRLAVDGPLHAVLPQGVHPVLNGDLFQG